MKRTDYQIEYRRNLPHYQPIGATLFVTIRLDGSLPRHLIERLKRERDQRRNQIRREANQEKIQDLLRVENNRYFGRFDSQLDRAEHGPTWLSNPAVAGKVYEELIEQDDKLYVTDAFTIMANHCHLIIQPIEDEHGNPISLSSIMMTLKGRTAYYCNKILHRNGRFWQHESYDHVIRDLAEWQRIITYVLNNPVKAGLVEKWEEWPWTYLREDGG